MADFTMHFSCSSFARYTDFLAHVKKHTDEAQLGTHIIYEDVEEDWARRVWTTLEEGYERRNIRKSLNTVARTFSLKIMPTEIHDCHQAWQRRTERDWVRSGLLTLDEADEVCIRVGTTLEFRSGPYRGSRKEPDMFLRPDGAGLPTLAIETGWSESSANLKDDMNLLLVGAAGAMRTVFILKWRKHNDGVHVSGTIEVYVLDANGMPVRRGPVLTIFPTSQNGQADVIRITRRELFWNMRLAPNKNPGDIFEYRVDVLRTVAGKSLTRMGLLPA